MRALLLAGGLGTRLRPITNTVPKCLVKIAGKPLLQYWLEALVAAGAEKILINTHYLHEQVEQFVESSEFASIVELRFEKALLGTLGSIKRYIDFFTAQDTLIVHADNFTNADLNDLLTHHRCRPLNSHLTMMLFKTETPQHCGIVTVNDQQMVESYIEKPSGNQFGNLANAAVVAVDKTALAEMVALGDSATDLCRDYLPGQAGKAFSYFHQDIFMDIGTPESLANARALMEPEF